MIIRMTFKDNDFQPQLERLGKEVLKNLYFGFYSNDELTQMPKEALMDIMFNNMKFTKLLNPNNSNEKTEEELNFIKDEIMKYCLKIIPKICNQNDIQYLTNNFEMDIVSSFTEKWENGEVLYLFTISKKNILQ